MKYCDKHGVRYSEDYDQCPLCWFDCFLEGVKHQRHRHPELKAVGTTISKQSYRMLCDVAELAKSRVLLPSRSETFTNEPEGELEVWGHAGEMAVHQVLKARPVEAGKDSVTYECEPIQLRCTLEVARLKTASGSVAWLPAESWNTANLLPGYVMRMSVRRDGMLSPMEAPPNG